MKKIIEDRENANGPSSSKKKAGSKSESSLKDHLQADKFELGNNLAAKKRRLNEDSDLTKKTKLKPGSRRNLL